MDKGGLRLSKIMLELSERKIRGDVCVRVESGGFLLGGLKMKLCFERMW